MTLRRFAGMLWGRGGAKRLESMADHVRDDLPTGYGPQPSDAADMFAADARHYRTRNLAHSLFTVGGSVAAALGTPEFLYLVAANEASRQLMNGDQLSRGEHRFGVLTQSAETVRSLEEHRNVYGSTPSRG